MHNPSRLTPLSKALLLSQMFSSRPSMAAMGFALCMPLASQVQAEEASAEGSPTAGTVNLAPTAIDSQLLGVTTDGTGSYTTGAVSIGKGAAQSLRETPQSVSVVTRQVMDDKNLTSLSEVLEDTPGMSFQYRNFGGHVYTSRGFSLLAESFLVDGIGGQGYQITGWMQPDMAIYDRVEVLRGASGLLVGAGQPGGAVNLVRKRPTAENKFSITTRAGSWDQYRVDLDGSGKLNDSGTLRGRMVAAYDDSGSYLDGRDSRTPLLYGIVEADVNDNTTLTMSLRRQEQVINGYSIYGLPRYSNGQSLGLSRSTNLAQDWNRLESDMTEVFTEIEHRFNDDWKSRTSLTYSQGGFDQAIAYARGAVNPTTLAGSTFQNTLFRKDEVNSIGLNSQLEGNINAFGLNHQLTLGADWSKQESNTKQATVRTASPINIFNVNQNAFAKPARPAWGNDIDMTEERAGLYANARIHLSEPLSVVLGSRLSWYDYQYDVKQGAANSYESKQTQEFTPFAGLIYDINDNWSWYASYADIFTPQADFVDVAGSPLDPAVGSNYETGFKGELFDKRLNLSMALFYIKQKDVAAVDLSADAASVFCPTSSDGSCYVQDGIKRSKGVELEASGEVLPGLQVFGGYTYNMLRNNGDAEVAYETPKHMLRLNTSYNLPGAWNRLTLGAGVSADSGYEVPSNDQLGVAGRAIWDARASWKLDENWRVSLNAENLFDRKYYTTAVATDRSNVYGEPRSYVLTLRGDF
ncbi:MULTISPECIES: TonB-dependent siderophore receptor [Pseudomonas]|uniref:TonB-dependent siderophore receptor n=2 Tax=Pseudomonas TaxID=286 RepID=A0AAU8LD81_PSESX|nr:TonB-dependent siderophore receptor [Pseudomonas triticifolii]MBC3955567.1 TonB-dependent siderophore receptor [Pseudomonas triticifolii]